MDESILSIHDFLIDRRGHLESDGKISAKKHISESLLKFQFELGQIV